MSASYPSGSLALDSPYYLERPTIEQPAYAEIQKPGSLIRIKAPREMGKTSLLLRLLEFAHQQSYHTVSLNLEQVDDAILNDLNRFLRWLCASVTRQLGLVPCLDDYWDEDIGSKVSCTLYFRGYLLEQIQKPLVLAIDEVNYLFEHPQVAKDVLPLFRSWFEEAKRLPVWQKLRLVVVHSTEIYVPLQITQSPFNVGCPIELQPFDLAQVKALAQRYQLDWLPQHPESLIALSGGHPALVHLAIYHLSCGQLTFQQFMETAATSSGIYNNHLQRHAAVLQEQPDLAQALISVMTSSAPLKLDPMQAYKLHSLGLINLVGDRATQGCELYRRYFAPSALAAPIPSSRRKRGVILTTHGLEKLQKEKREVEEQENRGQRLTLEQLSERTGLSVDTLMKVQAREGKVDKQTLKIYFQSFGLTLSANDFEFPPSEEPGGD
ncbi:AAA-like domain-containing protein [Alkalinema sp. FACHB-956]|nr:AAA-like domain-containing protein [Alkalinema sp. FACHB-956]MBD2329773.1 AAA-like domain-containing protein [Alkalinema sp. FACHB-956]